MHTGLVHFPKCQYTRPPPPPWALQYVRVCCTRKARSLTKATGCGGVCDPQGTAQVIDCAAGVYSILYIYSAPGQIRILQY